jgi:hypothetical protein
MWHIYVPLLYMNQHMHMVNLNVAGNAIILAFKLDNVIYVFLKYFGYNPISSIIYYINFFHKFLKLL